MESGADSEQATHAGCPAPGPPVERGAKRFLFAAGGTACVGLAYVGVLLPGLPTTPWVLLASYFFARSSPRLDRWLKRSPIFGRLLNDWHEHRGIRRPVKVLAVVLIATVVSLSIAYGGMPVWAKWLVGGFAAIGIGVVAFVVPTVRDQR